MTETPSLSIEPANHTWTRVLPRAVATFTILYQIMAILAFGVFMVAALEWFRLPYIGALVDNTLVVNHLPASFPGSLNARSQGVRFLDQVVAIDGQPVSTAREFIAVLKERQVGDEVALQMRSPDGALKTENMRLKPFPVRDRYTVFIVPYLVGLVYLGSGLWVLSLRRADAAARSFALFTASVAVGFAGMLDASSTNYLTPLWTFCLAMAGGALINLALIFPQESRWVKKRPYLSWLAYLLAFLITLLSLSFLYRYDRPSAYNWGWQIEYLFLEIAALTFLVLTLIRRFTSQSPVVRQQSTIILWGAIIAFVPLAIWIFIAAKRPGFTFPPHLLLPFGVFPVSMAYAILRYRLVSTDYLFSRAVLYALLTVITVVAYALLVSGLSLIFGTAVPANHPLVVGFTIFVLAMLINPLRNRLQAAIDRVFFRGQQVYQEKIQAFSSELTTAMDMSAITLKLRQYVNESLIPSQLHIFILDTLRDRYVAAPVAEGQPTTEITFSSNSPLVQMLSTQKSFLYLGEGKEQPPALVSEGSRLRLLGAQLFVPMPGRMEQVIGFLALSSRRSGEPYTNLDLDFLSSLSDQAALAVERVQVVADLERRVEEMNALIRLAQGINITLRFDDILELIYAQTNRVIPARDFWIMLYEPSSDSYHYAFYLEDDRRLLERESHPVNEYQDLAQLVIQTGQAVVTDDYERESRGRGIAPVVEGLYAWVGVPLNAGADTIGALCLGSRDPSRRYTADQVALLQAIADQAAGAIIKARALEDSERSARQLSLLNEIGRNLTSTLDLPDLLDQILEYALEILSCEAGTLFLVDDQTEELVFEVVKGPVALELVGKRLPPGAGHVGHAVQTGLPAIVNSARFTREWSKMSDEETGFETRDLILVPMSVKGKVVGVIEVINKLNGLPFNQEDLDLLSAFTSQAAIALENARLYTLTDQQLAERVDELAVMQRIDRELNASLDVSRAMRITLEWAMRRSKADAGLVGAVSEEGIRIMAEMGYQDELALYRDSVLPLELPTLKKAVDSEETQQFRRSEVLLESSKCTCLLEDAQSQLIIPVRREDKVVGVILLESHRDNPWPKEIQDFLSRLSDHAAIAIANAQLFNRVQEADQAKSEFISFVSHELKTPMTSIRGYTDLLLGGAVGEINDAQENFLNTIRANVIRMATLVSDLADVSRIESGRLRLDFMAINVREVVHEVVRSQSHSVKEKKQTLVVDISETLPLVWGDRTRVVQILTNLVSNAHKYTPPGGQITIVAQKDQPQASSMTGSEMVRIAVQDNGYGMAEEDQSKIFTKFFRSEDPNVREASGTGLGLNITRNLVEMQGGRIWFESEFGQGTTFYFTLPIAEVG